MLDIPSEYSGVAVVFVSTVRKVVTVVLSFVAFSHRTNSKHLLGGVLLVAGTLLRVKMGPSRRGTSATTNGDVGGGGAAGGGADVEQGSSARDRDVDKLLGVAKESSLDTS